MRENRTPGSVRGASGNRRPYRDGRGWYEIRGEKAGYRNGYENGTLKTAEGVLRMKLPQIRGGEEPYRSPLWRQVATTSDVLKRLSVERYVEGCRSGTLSTANASWCPGRKPNISSVISTSAPLCQSSVV